MPFTQAPPSRSAVDQGGRGIGVIATIMLGLVLLFLCTTVVCVGLPLLLSLFSGK
jgi:tetrahydromethanopterin S-methyltransferase subunit G